ncbi:neutral zinc metallopeptidase, partial [Janthinobacterium sp. HH107]
MKWEGNRESDNVEDRRGEDGGGGGGGGGFGYT